jgi:ABC-2 type transport system permease protein
VPGALGTAFYLNPLTYIVDVTRAGIFNQITMFTNIEVGIITAASAGAFFLATLSLMKLKI